MRLSVGTDQAGSVDCEYNRKLLEADVMHKLIITSLQETGIHGKNRTKSDTGESCRGSHGVRLRNTYIKETLGIGLLESRKPRSVRHGCRYGNNLFIFLRFFQ